MKPCTTHGVTCTFDFLRSPLGSRSLATSSRKVRDCRGLSAAGSFHHHISVWILTVFLPSDQLYLLKGSSWTSWSASLPVLIHALTSRSVAVVSATPDRQNSMPEFRVAEELCMSPQEYSWRKTLSVSIEAETSCKVKAVMRASTPLTRSRP